MTVTLGLRVAVVAHDKTGLLFLDGPRRREAAAGKGA